MTEIYSIPQFLHQLEELGFYVDGVREPRQVRRFFGNYVENVQRFRINGLKATVFEKVEPHRIRYRGPIPLQGDPKKLAFFNRSLEAYEREEGQWERTDKYRHVNFP